MRRQLGEEAGARIEYGAAVDAETLQTQEKVNANTLLAAAVYFGKTRLIDNLRLE